MYSQASRSNMEFDDVIEIINKISIRQRSRQLSAGEKVAVAAAWHKQDYKDALADAGNTHSLSYISSQAGPDVWRLLTSEFGREVNKNILKPLLLEYCKKLRGSKKVHQPSQVLGSPPQADDFIGYQSQAKECISNLAAGSSIFIYGPQGVGKSSLASHVLDRVKSDYASSFDLFIWKSLHYKPSFTEFLDDFMRMLDIVSQASTGVEARMGPTIDFFRRNRCLLVLDDAQVLLEGEKSKPWEQYSERYRNYGLFFRRLIEEQNSTVMVLISQKRFPDLSDLKERGYPITLIQLDGLGSEAQQMLARYELKDPSKWPELIEKYRGNPLALKIISKRIKTLYGGRTSDFLKSHSTVLSDPFLMTLHSEFEASSMSHIERDIMTTLAFTVDEMPSISFEELLQQLLEADYSYSSSHVYEAVSKLVDRSLIIKVQEADGSEFSLPPIVKKYILTDPLGLVHQKAQLSDA